MKADRPKHNWCLEVGLTDRFNKIAGADVLDLVRVRLKMILDTPVIMGNVQ